jgi:tripartite ATP-independent transporter DctP family solute receptor
MDRKAFSFLIVGLLTGAFLTAGLFSWLARGGDGGGGDRVVLKLAHVLPPAAPVHKGMVRFAELVAEKSGGTVEVQIFHSGTLGSETETLEQLQRGALAMIKSSTAAMEGFVPEMAIFSVPYVFRDEEHFWNVLNSPIGQELLAMGQRVNIHGLCYYDAGARSFYTVPRPINSPADLRGLKIRTMRSPTAERMIEVMGGSPSALAFGELYTALQQGVVDGAENNPPSVFDSRHWEVAKYYSLDEHSRIPDILVFSHQIWQSLPPHVQGWLTEAAAESVPYQREVWREYVEECLANLRAEGVIISEPDKAPFKAAVASMYTDLEGTPVGDLIQRVQEIR